MCAEVGINLNDNILPYSITLRLTDLHETETQRNSTVLIHVLRSVDSSDLIAQEVNYRTGRMKLKLSIVWT